MQKCPQYKMFRLTYLTKKLRILFEIVTIFKENSNVMQMKSVVENYLVKSIHLKTVQSFWNLFL